MAGPGDFRLCAQQKYKPHLSPHYRGVGQEYWQILSYLPSASRVVSDKIKANEKDGKTQAMPKAWGKSQCRLNRTTWSDPHTLYLHNTTKLDPPKGGRVGNKITVTVCFRSSYVDE